MRWHKQGKGELLGSLLLGLYDESGRLNHVGITSSFTMAKRKALVAELQPLMVAPDDRASHPWGAWQGDPNESRKPGMQSRWSAGKDLSFVPLKPERVVEVKFDHLQGSRFRHATTFVRWRPDKQPKDCGYDQIETTPPYELAQIFGS
jgi:ATP-dependent DNA ligase